MRTYFTNLGLAVVVFRRDIVWCISASWICASIWSLKPKPFPVFVCLFASSYPPFLTSTLNNQVTAVAFTIIHPLALVASALWMKLRGTRRGEGAIHLPEDEEEGVQGRQNGPREVDADALWG